MFKNAISIFIACIIVFAQLPVSASQIIPDFYVSEVVENSSPEDTQPQINTACVEQLESDGEPASFGDFDKPSFYGRDALLKLSDGKRLVAAYDRLVAGIENFEEEILMYDSQEMQITAEELSQIFTVYRCDHPEHFWSDVNSYGYTTDCKIVKPNYLIKKNALSKYVSKFEDTAEDIFDDCGITTDMSEYEISLSIHDTLAEHITYDKTQNAEYIHTAYGALVNGIAVCDGYARAYQLLLGMAGIQSYIVTGSSINPTTHQPEGHAWNLVCIDGKYYYTDLTWDDKKDNIYYSYFNVDDRLIDADHVKESSVISFPACESTDANYFENNPGKMSAKGDVELVLQLFELGKQRGENFARIMLTNGNPGEFLQWLAANSHEVLFEILHGLGIGGAVKYMYMSVGNEIHFWTYNELNEADISTHLEPPHANTFPYLISKNSFECNGDFEITKVKWKELKNNKWQDIDGKFDFHTIYGIELTLKGKDNKYFSPYTLLTVNEKNDHIVKQTEIPSDEYVIIYTFDPTEDEPVMPTASMEYIESAGEVEITADITGTYTVVLADYEDEKLVSTKTVDMEFSAGEATEIKLNELFPNADKVMLWDSESTLHPLCGVLKINKDL